MLTGDAKLFVWHRLEEQLAEYGTKYSGDVRRAMLELLKVRIRVVH